MPDDYQTDAEKALRAQSLVGDIDPKLYNQQVTALQDRAVAVLDDLAAELERLDGE